MPQTVAPNLIATVVASETRRLHLLMQEYFLVSPEDFARLYEELKKAGKNVPTPREYLLSIGFTRDEASFVLERNPSLISQ